MIFLNIDPIAVHIGHFMVRWYGIFIALGVAVGIWLTLREAKRKWINTDHIYNAALWVIPAGIVGARLLHVIDDWPNHAANPWTIIGTDGLAIFGALIGGLLALVAYAWVHRLALWRLTDVVAPAIPLGQAIGRIGCFINGCNYGWQTDGTWGVVWTSPNSMAPTNVPLQPAQLYELVWDAFIFGIVWKLRTRVQGDGVLFVVYAALYSLGRFFISFLRADNLYFAELRQAQIIALATIAFAIPLVVWLNRRTVALGTRINAE
ncbi:MAG: prolipoprotein diacylglyceryl transferase [Chloroflexota bacterium]|nr:prolipoprotein diacylglyceryl transferase [Chloroflexota bacterium]